MNRTRLATLLLLVVVGVHYSTADIATTVSYQKSVVNAAFTAVSGAIKDRASDIRSMFKTLIGGVVYNQDWTKFWMGYVLADPVTGPMANKISKELTATGQALLDSMAPVADNISATFDAVSKAISPTMTANLSATMDAISAADTNITIQFSLSLFKAPHNAFSRTLTAVSDYAQLAGNNFRSMGTTADYCNSLGLTRPDLKNRTIACLQSLLEYAIPQLNEDLAYQQDIVVQLAATEAGNSIGRAISGINSVAEQAITAARMLPDDVANCFKTGV
ncbi:hypothetical protein quinque_010600 [Culex quinquefasciatus]